MASIFEAEARGKDYPEDILTSRVFGIFNITDRVVLHRFLKRIGINLPLEEVRKAEISLWEQYNDSIPDVVIRTESSLIFVESKLDSPISIEQLRKEYEEGIKESDSFCLLCITKDFSVPEEIERFKKELKTNKVFWTSWQNLYAYLSSIEKLKTLDSTSKSLIKELKLYLETQRLRGFSGFKDEDIKKVVDAYDSFENFYNEISIFIQELESQLKKHEIELKRTGVTSFDRDGRGTRLDAPEEWVTSYLSFAFGRQEWPFRRFGRDCYLFVRFLISKPAVLWVGFRIRPDKANQRKVWIKHKNQIINKLKELPDIQVEVDWGENFYTPEELPEELFDTEKLRKHYELGIIYEIPLEKKTDRTLLEIVREKIVQLCDMITELNFISKVGMEEETEAEEMEEIEDKDRV